MINLPKMPRGSKGKFGSYQNLGDGRGIKVFYKQGYTIRELWDFYTKKDYRIPYDWEAALKEATLLEYIQSSNLAVKYFGITIVKIRNKYYPGLLMEHIDGEHLPEYMYKSYKAKAGKVIVSPILKCLPYHGEIQNYINKEFAKHNFDHGDIHSKNVIIDKNNNIKVIDYGERFCHVKGEYDSKKAISETVKNQFFNEFDETVTEYKENLKLNDKTLLYQKEINSICYKYWKDIFSISCEGNKIVMLLDYYNQKRKQRIVNYVQKECSKILKSKITVVNESIADNKLNIKVELVC